MKHLLASTAFATVVRGGGIIAFYVWDYPGGGIEFMRAFWNAATALDPGAQDLTEDRRFPFCTPEALMNLAREPGLAEIECAPIEVPTIFQDSGLLEALHPRGGTDARLLHEPQPRSSAALEGQAE